MKIFLQKIVILISELKLLQRLFSGLVAHNPTYAKLGLEAQHRPSLLTYQRVTMQDVLDTFNLAKQRKFDDQPTYFFKTDAEIDCPSFLKPLDTLTEISDVPGEIVIITAFESDEIMADFLQEALHLENVFVYCAGNPFPPARYFHRNAVLKSVLLEDANMTIPKGRTNFFDIADMENIAQALDLTANVKGDYVEIGVWQGRSAHFALNYMKKNGIKRLGHFFDLFSGFSNDASKNSSDAFWAGTHGGTPVEAVREFLSDFENSRVDVLDIIVDEIPSDIKTIAVANIDVDMYEAVLIALKKVAARMPKFGIIISEDQGHTPMIGGAFLATKEFLDSDLGKLFLPIHLSSGQMYLIKIA